MVDAAGSDVEKLEIPGYSIAERIGAGGFGEVLRARHDLIGRDVAIKILHARYSTDPDAIARFVAEARAVGQISHPGIVDLYDFGELADGRQYCVMELIRGRTLREVLRERTRLPLGEALPILRGIAEAVDAAHAVGIAHRDLKPDNVFVLDAGGVKVIDFGLAKLVRDDPTAPTAPRQTETGAVFGTPLYMSPEQCRGKAIDIRTDAYSFGALAYQVLTGEPPFAGDALQLALQHLNDTPEPPSRRLAELPARVDAAILALLAKDPAARPLPLANAVAAMASTRVPKQRRRWLVWSIPVVAAVGLALGALALATRSNVRPAHTGPQTVTVLGFENRGDADHAWIGMGLAQILGPALQANKALRVPAVNTVREELEELGIAPTDAPSHEDMERIRAAFSPDEVVVGWFHPHAGMVEIDAKLLAASRELIAEATEDVPEAELPQAAMRIAARVREVLGAPELEPSAVAQGRKLWPVRVETMRHYALGLAALEHADHARAIVEATQATALEPDFAPAHYVLGAAFGGEADARSVGELEQAVRLSVGLPESERLRIEARYRFELGDYALAAPLFRRLLELDPQDLLAGIAAAWNLFVQGQPQQVLRAVATLRALPAPASSDPNLDELEAEIESSQGHFDRCVLLATRSEASALRARRPNLVLQARNSKLVCLLGLGELDEVLLAADDMLSRARVTGPWWQTSALEWKCMVLQRHGDLTGAEAVCREAVDVLPPTMNAQDRRDAWVALARVLVDEKKSDDARVALATAERACVDVRPPCHPDYGVEASLRGWLDGPDAKRKIFSAALDAARAVHDDRTTAWALRDLAVADYLQLRRGDDCDAEAREAIAITVAHPDRFADDDRAETFHTMGFVLAERDRFDEGMAAREKAFDILKLVGNERGWQRSHNRAVALIYAGRFGEAEAWTRDAIDGGMTSDDERATLVEALVAQGKLADADKVVAELTGKSPYATFARAWVALHHGKPVTTERRALDAQLVELDKAHALPRDIARLELAIARLAVAAGDPGARKKLSALAVELRAKGLGGFATLAEREATQP